MMLSKCIHNFPRYQPRIRNETTNVVHMTRNDHHVLIFLGQNYVPSSPWDPSSRRGSSDRQHPRTFVVFHLPLGIRQAGEDLLIDDIRVTCGIYFVHISMCNVDAKETLTTAMRCMNVLLFGIDVPCIACERHLDEKLVLLFGIVFRN